jgi:hypothetical protein
VPKVSVENVSETAIRSLSASAREQIYNAKSLSRALLALAFLCSTSAPAEERKSMFVFQDNFWLNLHQFLRGEVYRRSIKATPGLDIRSLPEVDRDVWNRAIDSYLDVASRNVLFDNLSRKIGNALATPEMLRCFRKALMALSGLTQESH